MANHKSSEKRARQETRRNTRNSQIKAAIKTAEKAVLKAVETKSKEAPELLKAFVAKIMSGTNKGVVKKETASRKVSRISTRVHNSK